MNVVAEAEPVSTGETARSVDVLDVAPQRLMLQDIEDPLRTDPSVDIQQRGPMGVQSDISVRGSSFEQTLVLLNGLRMNDAETSHFNLDVPVPLTTIGTADVLHGAGSTLYGSDAIGGVVDVLTAVPTQSSLRLRAGGGNFGVNTQDVLANAVRGKSSVVLAASRDFSSGFAPDRDYRSEDASVEPRFETALGGTDLLFAASDRAFGAAGFYGNYPAWERTKGWFAALTQSLGTNTSAAVAYRRHSDEFVLIRNHPEIYENNHIDQSWQGVLRRQDSLGTRGRLFTGVEEDTDGIRSNSLGVHGRNQTSAYVDADLHAKALTVSAGLREEVLSGGRVVSSPTVAASVLMHQRWKLRGSAGYGFRLPTYVDLYYNDPTTKSNPALKPESAWSYDAGVDWYPRSNVAVSATAFVSRQSDAIDYVRASAQDKWQAQNLQHVRFTGAEVSFEARPAAGQSVRVGYTALVGAQSALGGLQSEYIFNYPVNRATVEWFVQRAHGITLRPMFAVTQRYGIAPYSTADFAIAREAGMVHPYVQVTNLYNTGYAEVLDVRMPGRGVVAGVDLLLTRRR